MRVEADNLKATTDNIKSQFKKTWDQVEKDFTNKTAKGAKKVESSFKGMFSAIARFVSVVAIFGFTKKLIQAWSDLEEFQSKFNTVFKGVEDQAKNTFEVMAEATGRSYVDLIRGAGTLGDTLKPLWFAADEALALSENITKLSIDVASFNNVSDDQAIAAMTKALTGEREALKSLGIVINETDVKRKAYELGLASQWQELSKQAKALATYQLLLDNTSDAQGDAVRTADSFANQLKRLQGTIKDLMSSSWRTISQETAGILKTVTTFVKQYGAAIFDSLIEVGRSIGAFFSDLWSFVGDLMTAVGVDVSNGQSKMQVFGTVILAIISAVGIGLRAFGFAFKSTINIVAAFWEDAVAVFLNGANLIGTIFGAAGRTITWVAKAIGNNMIAGIQQGIEWVISGINNMVKKLENLIGVDLFGDINYTASRTMQDIGAITQRELNAVSASVNAFTSDFGSATSAAWAQAQNDFGDFWVYIIQQNEKITQAAVKSANTQADAYDTWFAWVNDLMGKFGDLAGDAHDTAAKGAGKAKDATKDLEDAVDDLNDRYEDLEKMEKDLAKAQEDYAKASKEYFDDLKDSIDEVNNAIAETNAEFEKGRREDVQSFLRWEIEDQVALEKEIAELQQEQSDNADEILEKQKELEAVKANIASLATGDSGDLEATIAEERRRAEMSDAERRGYDFAQEQDEKKKAHQEEIARLEQERRIYQTFQDFNFQSIDDLNKLKEEKTLEQFSFEEQKLIEQLANDRIKLLQQRDEKIQMERDVAIATIDLHNRVNAIASANIASLESKYQSLIRTIQAAISAQRALAAANSVSRRYKGWPVSAGQPYLVWENPDGSINSTTEMIIPNQSGYVVNAGKVQEALKSVINSNVDRSKSVQIENYYNQKVERTEDIIAKLFFRL